MKPKTLGFETKQRVRYLLRSLRGGWVKRDVIVKQLGIPDNAFRNAVSEMIETGDPIATSFRRGYSWATDPETVEAAARELETKAIALHVRASALRDTARRMRSPVEPAEAQIPLALKGGAGYGPGVEVR